MSPDQQDYYAILGITRDASQEDIKRAYFKAAQKLHPDKNTAAGETELFIGVQQAYEVLSNPKRPWMTSGLVDSFSSTASTRCSL